MRQYMTGLTIDVTWPYVRHASLLKINDSLDLDRAKLNFAHFGSSLGHLQDNAAFANLLTSIILGYFGQFRCHCVIICGQ